MNGRFGIRHYAGEVSNVFYSTKSFSDDMYDSPGMFLITEDETNRPHSQLISIRSDCGQYQRGKDSTRCLF